MEVPLQSNTTAIAASTEYAADQKTRKRWINLAYAFALVGVLLRVYHFFYNRSLWTDEMYLSVSLINKGFLELATSPLEFQQKAPIGFLWLVKLCVVLFGKGEMALRLIPLLSGIAAVYLFIPVCKQLLKPFGVAAATGILALGPFAIYHAVEIKQYGFEMFSTVVCLYLYLIYSKRKDIFSLFMWGLAGGAMVWFSYSSILVLGGIAAGFSLHNLLKKRYNLLFKTFLPFSIWLVNILVNYILFIAEHTDDRWLINWFTIRDGYLPIPPSSVQDLQFLVQVPYRMLFYPLGLLWEFVNIDNGAARVILRMGFIPMFFWILGMVYLLRRNLKLFLVLALPVLLTAIASAVGKYPFYERLIFFLTPLVILFIATGFERLVKLFKNRLSIQITLLTLLLTGPLVVSAMQAFNTRLFGDYKRNYQRECWLHIEDNFKSGDIVYVYWNIRYGNRFYKNSYDLKYKFIEGTDFRPESRSANEYLAKMKGEIQSLKKYNRVWLVYEKDYWVDIGDFDGRPAWYWKNYRLLNDVKQEFVNLGKQVEVFDTKQARVILVDVKNNMLGPTATVARHDICLLR